MDFPDGPDIKESTYSVGDLGSIPGSGRSPRERDWLPTPVFWRISWTEEPGGLQSMGSQRVGHNSATNTFTFHFQECYKIDCSEDYATLFGKSH